MTRGAALFSSLCARVLNWKIIGPCARQIIMKTSHGKYNIDMIWEAMFVYFCVILIKRESSRANEIEI
jgi:hypothetical protein